MSNCKTCCNTEDQANHHKNQPNQEANEHNHGFGKAGLIISLVIFGLGIIIQYSIQPNWFVQNEWIRLLWFLAAYIPVALPVWQEALELFAKKDFFNEFSLMGIATLGAFLLQEYPEGVAVMLFYTIGEMFQERAVNKAKGDIKALLDVRPKFANVKRNNQYVIVDPENVQISETILVKAGEKVPLDGILLSNKGTFNTAALTGESKPYVLRNNETVLAGMLNLDHVIELRATKKYEDSSIARILQMVQEASSRKAKTELFIRKFAKIYTPTVFFIALALVVIPMLFVDQYIFKDWLYRGLIFLVVSCPCALVISVPLGYFGGIGAASRNGILFKGSNFLEQMASVNTVVMDKTGTLTEGVFKVQEINVEDIDLTEFLDIVSAIEQQSTHPIAKAIVAYHPSNLEILEVNEISGKGLKGKLGNKEVLVGNGKLLDQFEILYPKSIDNIVESSVVVALDGQYKGYIIVADQLKADSLQAIKNLHQIGVYDTMILSGDKDSITQKIAKQLGISKAFGGLLPEDKVEKIKTIKNDPKKVVAFVGDGINDAPVLALSDVGIAMGGLGSDAAIETADVVIQTDQPAKIATAIKIGRATRKIVLQNIILALGVKVLVLILGALGLSNMWEAVIADVGVALLAILNAVRIQRMQF